MGPGRGDGSHPHLGPALGTPGAPSLGTTTLARVTFCPQAELEGLPGEWSLDSLFACHTSRSCPSALFGVSAKHA